jgi:Flp pilus assembly protein TadG
MQVCRDLNATTASVVSGSNPRIRSALRRGAAVAEFAVIAPVFFMMIIGFVEFGRALMVEQVLVNASRVGARQAITAGATTTTVTNTVEDYAEAVSVSDVTASVSPNPADAETGQLITVTVSVGFDSVSWLPAPWFLEGKTLSASSTMRKEGLD